MFENLVESKKQAFGLDIGYRSLKVVELKKRGDNFSLVGYREVPITPNAVQKNGILRKKEITDAIKLAVASSKPNKITTKRVSSALPALFAMSKVIKLPMMKTQELDKVIPYEAADFFPVPVNEMNLDWHVINSIPASGSKGELEVLVIGAPKNLVNDYIEVIENANLELVALETKPISAARAVTLNEKDAVALVDIGENISSVSITDKGLIKITSTINIGGGTMTKDIASGLGISVEEAEIMKISDGLELGKKNAKNLAIIKNLKLIIQEIYDNIKYYQTRIKKNTKVSKIILFGGGAELNHIDNFIEKELSIPTKLANPWEKIKAKQSDIPAPKYILKYATAIGLAMREL